MEFSRASATLFINNIFHNSVNYNDHEHIIYVEDESHVSLYPVDILDDGMIPEEFPESIATVSINKRQIERIYTVLGDFMERIEEFQELKATTLKMMEDYDTIRDEIIRIISEPSLRPMFQDGEFFDPDVHTLLVSYHKDGWCLEYIRTEDAVEFFNVKKAEDVSFSVEFNKK